MSAAGPIAAILPVAAPALPLLLVLAVPFCRRPLLLLPWAAIPGIAAALLTPTSETVVLPILLIGIGVRLDGIGSAFLGFGSLLWLLAGIYAARYMHGERTPTFAMFWLFTMTGTLGTFVAADVVTFYAAFSVMSLAAYGLVLHERTGAARRAGGIYIVLAVIGEGALLAAIMLAATNANSILLDDVRTAIAASPWSASIMTCLVVGFGIKAGLVPLHAWLPLAHPVAPTPASAVLSGVIVKGGIVGLIRFLPVDAAMPGWGEALIVAGLFTAYYGVAVGLVQREAKIVLAYSTLSQMGLLIAVLGAGLGRLGAVGTAEAATLYALHHGLAKGALFLAVGVVAASGARALRPVMATTALAALAIAGLPLTGGALAKLAIKPPFGDSVAALLVTLSAVGTAMLMLRFLWVLRQGASAEPDARPPAAMVVPWAAAIVAALVLPFAMLTQFSDYEPAVAFAPVNLWAALWPLLIAAAAALVAIRWRLPRWRIEPGDVAVAIDALMRLVPRIAERVGERISGAIAVLARAPAPDFGAPLAIVERTFGRWRASGPAFVIVAVALGLALAN